jgi:hypothetical protein
MRTTQFALVCLLPVALAAGIVPRAHAQPAAPAFVLETAKAHYLVGEPVVIVVTQRGAATLYEDGWIQLGADDAHLRILVDRGAGFVAFKRRLLYSRGEPTTRRTLAPDNRRQELVLSFDDAIGDVMFPNAGVFRLAIEYRDEILGTLRSNLSTVEVSQPTGEEREAYDRLRRLPGGGAQFYLDLTSPDDAPTLSDDDSRQLIAAFPRSRYLQGARVRSLEFRVGRPSDRFNADDPHSPAPLDRRERNRLVRERRAALVNEAHALLADLAGGQFEPDVLAALATTYEANGQDGLARRTWLEILERFPRRAVADEAREALEPDDPAN